MTSEKRDVILAMARHEFSEDSIYQLKANYQQKLMLEDYSMYGYTLTKGELLALFETLIKDKADAKADFD